MTKRGKRILKITGLTVAAFMLAGLALLYSVAEPETALGYSIFRVAYSYPLITKPILRAYSAGFQKYNGGYMGEPVDKFLCARLEATDSEGEVAAITDFYILQAGGREGQSLAHLSDEARQKAIKSIMQRVDAYDAWQTLKALLIVEWLRRGEVLCKAIFAPHPSWRDTPVNYDWEKWWVKEGTQATKTLYRTWWDSNLSWPEKKLIDPLNTSLIRIGQGCG